MEGILENWSKLKPIIMEEWAENRVEWIYTHRGLPDGRYSHL